MAEVMIMRLKNRICLLLALVLLLCLEGCGEDQGSGPSEVHATENVPAASKPREAAAGEGTTKEPKTVYQAPEFADSAFHEDQAQGEGDVWLDLSAVSQGYVAVSAKSEKRLKFQVIKGDTKYPAYNIASDGTPSVFPLQSGDGEYQFRVMENTTDTKYVELYSAVCTVVLEDEFQPFLRPSDYVNYNQQSVCVQRAKGIAGKSANALEVVSGVYSLICDTVKYDKEKAATVQKQKDYLPDPDETLGTGKGICFDYAALAAAMLRSQGIPTKMVFGNVSPDDLYHAWNMFYTEETGWVTVSFEVEEGWNRLDLTFSANGTDRDFIGDGSNYSDTYYY